MILLHPFIFAVYQVVFLYALNARETPLEDIVLPIILALLLCLSFFILIKLLLKDTYKAGFLTSVFLILFFSYGHIFDFLRITPFDKIIQARHLFIYILYIFIFVIALYKTQKTEKSFFRFTKILNITSCILLSVPLIMTASFFIKNAFVRMPPVKVASEEKFDEERIQNKENLPDIYYIILDRYAGENTLNKIYHYDNSDFLSELKEKGFYIASQAQANYSTTTHSLASSFNMVHLDNLGILGEQNYTDWNLLNRKVSDNEVLRILKSIGYKTIYFGSWWAQSRVNRYADTNINIDTTPGFHYLILSKTILHPIRVKMGLVPDFLREQYEREQLKFKKLRETAFQSGPKFVFAHFLITHEPYTFREDGSFLDEKSQENMTGGEKYLGSLKFTNKEIVKLVNYLLEDKGKYNPVIIIQADEGPYPDRVNADIMNFDWNKAKEEEITEKMGILNSYYLPDGGEKLLYPLISPVNTFRVVFNYYLNQNYQLLKDDSFLSNQKQPYIFIPVKKNRVR